MCRDLVLREKRVSSQRELEQISSPLIYYADAPPGARTGGDQCLCWVDMQAMADREGWSLACDNMDWIAQ